MKFPFWLSIGLSMFFALSNDVLVGAIFLAAALIIMAIEVK